jgi:hypothetical protein
MSQSEQLRKEGNDYFQRAQEPNCQKEEQKKCYQQAVRSFLAAKTYATDVDELASATRNLSLAAFKLAETSWDPNSTENSLKAASLGISSLVTALKKGLTACKENKWHESLLSLTQTSLNSMINLAEELSVPQRLDVFRTMAFHFGVTNHFPFSVKLAGRLNATVGELLFKYAVSLMSDGTGGFAKPLHLLYQVDEFLKRAKSFDKSIDTENLEMDTREQCEYCRLKQVLARGEHMFNMAVKEEEVLNIEGLWLALDRFNEVLSEENHQKAQSIDLQGFTISKPVEIEAEACCWMGRVHKILGDQKKSYDYCLLCMHMSLALPGNAEVKQYYKIAKNIVQEYRKKQGEEEEDPQKTIIRSKISPKLDKLAELAKKSSDCFVKEVMTEFPPREIKAPKDQRLVSILQAASLTYSRSRNHKDTTLEDKVLFEEVEMILNSKLVVAKSQ